MNQPREVLGSLVDTEGVAGESGSGRSRRDEDLRPWIDNMKSWMRQKAKETARLLQRSETEDEAYLASECVRTRQAA